MARLNVYVNQREIDLEVDSFSAEALDKIIDNTFLLFGVQAPVRTIEVVRPNRNVESQIKGTPITVKKDLMNHHIASVPKPIKARAKAGEDLDERINEFVHHGLEKNFSKVVQTKSDYHEASGEVIDNEAEMSKPFNERIYVPINIECPTCGHAGKKNARYGLYYSYCPKCNTKLHMKPATDKYGVPDEKGYYYCCTEIQREQQEESGSDD